jgi:hypothetical protein
MKRPMPTMMKMIVKTLPLLVTGTKSPVADSRNRGDTEVERVEPVPTLDRGVEERSGKKCRGNKHHGRPEARLTPVT